MSFLKHSAFPLRAELTSIADSAGFPQLQVIRLPGECGPVLRCFGEVCEMTADRLKREIGFLISLGRPTLIVDLSACRYLDLEGILLLLDAEKQLHEKGSHVVLVSGAGPVAQTLASLGVDSFLSVFPTLQSANSALRGGGPQGGPPPNWEEARQESLERWRTLSGYMEVAPLEEIGPLLLSKFPLCDRAAAEAERAGAKNEIQCRNCPLFHCLGAHPADIGCRSVFDPILRLLAAGDRAEARRKVGDLIRTIETMPVTPP